MSNKEAVIEIVRKMPEEVTLEEILQEIEILAAIRRGEEAVQEGRVISHEDVKPRLGSHGVGNDPVRARQLPTWIRLLNQLARTKRESALETGEAIPVVWRYCGRSHGSVLFI